MVDLAWGTSQHILADAEKGDTLSLPKKLARQDGRAVQGV